MDLFDGYLVNGFPEQIADVDAMTALLQDSFGDINIKETNRNAWMACRQYDDLTSTFLPTWDTLHQKSGSTDVAMAIHFLQERVHPRLLWKLTLTDEIPATMGEFLRLLRKHDGVLRRTEGENYVKKGAEKRPTLPSASAHPSVSIRAIDTTSPLLDKDGLLLWVPNGDIRPKNDEERAAYKRYCIKHDLCKVCMSSEHTAPNCPKSYYNRKKKTNDAMNGGAANPPLN